jgi:hypothetical protein
MTLKFPVEMAIRCFYNLAVKYTSDTDIDDLVAKLCKADFSSLEDGINILLEVDLLTATDGLKKILSIIPVLLEMQSKKIVESNNVSEKSLLES